MWRVRLLSLALLNTLLPSPKAAVTALFRHQYLMQRFLTDLTIFRQQTVHLDDIRDGIENFCKAISG